MWLYEVCCWVCLLGLAWLLWAAGGVLGACVAVWSVLVGVPGWFCSMGEVGGW